MFTTIDRYIGRIFLTYFAMGILVLLVLYVAADFLGLAMGNDANLSALARYYLYLAPGVMHQMIPIAALIATVFTLTSLNSAGELTAMYSVGMSLARISAPILVLVALISTVAFMLADQVLPRINQFRNYVYYVEIKKQPGLYSTVKTNKIWYRSENVLFNIKTLNAPERRAQGLTLYYFDSTWKLVQLINAVDVQMQDREWILTKGSVTLFTDESSFPLTKAFQSKTITMNEEIGDLQSASHSSDVLTVNQLGKFIRKNKDAGLNTMQYEVDYQSKFSFAFAAFVMTLIGIPFSVNRARSGGAMISVGLCMLLAFVYWALYSSSMALGKHGTLPALAAAWTPNFLVSIFAVYLLMRLKR